MNIKRTYLVYFIFVSSVIGIAISYSKLYLFHITLALLLLSLIQELVSNNLAIKVNKLPTKLHYIFLIMFFWYLTSIVWSGHIRYSLEYLFYIICGSTISLSVIYYSKTLNDYKKAFNIISFIFVIEIIVSLVETFTNFRLPTSPYSEYIRFFGRDPAKFYILNDHTQNATLYLTSSPTGFHSNPNNLATTMSLIFPFFLFHPNKIIKFTGLISIIIIIISTGSRGNMICVLFMFLLNLIYTYKKILIGIFLLPFTFIFIPLVTEFSQSFIGYDNVKLEELFSIFTLVSNVFSSENSSSYSVSIRKELINDGIDALVQSYGLGLGGGRARALQEKMGGVAEITSMHNFWIEILVEGGVLFAFFFILWYIYVIYLLYRISLTTNNHEIHYFASSTSVSMLGFFIGATSPSTCIYLFPMWMLWGFSVATINIFHKFSKHSVNHSITC